LVLAGVIWTRRPAPGAGLYSLFMLLWGVWAFFNGFENGAVDYQVKIFWAKMEYFGIVASGLPGYRLF